MTDGYTASRSEGLSPKDARRKVMSHDLALEAICGVAASVTILSYQEAIEGYLDLRGLSSIYKGES